MSALHRAVARLGDLWRCGLAIPRFASRHALAHLADVDAMKSAELMRRAGASPIERERLRFYRESVKCGNVLA